MGNTLKQGVKFLGALGYSEDQAMTMLTTACDFSITQIVDGNCAPAAVLRRHALAAAHFTLHEVRLSPLEDRTCVLTACISSLVHAGGCQVNIPKYILTGTQTTPYTQSTTCGGSQAAVSTPNPPPKGPTMYTLAANASTVHWCGRGRLAEAAGAPCGYYCRAAFFEN